jgi:anthranilate phosphoribosyltransferase
LQIKIKSEEERNKNFNQNFRNSWKGSKKIPRAKRNLEKTDYLLYGVQYSKLNKVRANRNDYIPEYTIPKKSFGGKMLAYVLLGVSPNTEDKVFKKVKILKEVRDTHLLFGSWDIIATVEVNSVAGLNEFMLEKIRKIPEVTLTATMIVAK